MNRCIAIGGFMGVGKSTVGRRLAARLNRDFVDLDRAIEETEGQSISDIFEALGEQGFRDAESKELGRILSGPSCVIALGGGTLHFGDNCEVIQARAELVCIGLPLADIRARLGEIDVDRPLWGNAEQLFSERLGLYRSAGHYIDIRGMSVEAVATRIEEVLQCA